MKTKLKKSGERKAKIKWLWWRLTGYRELSKLLHGHMAKTHNALTPIGLKRMEELLQIEDDLFIKAFRKHWIK